MDYISLCQKLSSLSAVKATEVYNIILSYSKKSPNPPTKRFGTKSTIPYSGEMKGEDIVFNTDNLPEPLLQEISDYLKNDSE